MSAASGELGSRNFGLSPLITRNAAFRKCVQLLRADGIDDPYLDARLLICAAAEINHLDLIGYPEATLGDRANDRLSHFIARRIKNEPVSRILGTRGFWSVDLAITSDVLDPRHDTETLVIAAKEHLTARRTEMLRIADLGTGSGALICALLTIFPNAIGTAVDVSQQACDVARSNLLQCGFHTRSSILCGSWYCIGPGPFDLIVSNPPYIRTADIPTLPQEVRDFDPLIALDGGIDGLKAYREIIALLPALLAPGGLSILEIGSDQEAAVSSIVTKAGLDLMGVRNDFGGNPRAILAQKR